MEAPSLPALSEALLLAVRTGKTSRPWLKKLEEVPVDSLKDLLPTDTSKNTFWINLYNAWFLILRKELGMQKPDIYRQKVLSVAGMPLSLDDVEHGILRRYRWKYSLGYLPNLLTPGKIKRLAVSKVDFRIHFALNCGAVSCPPIALYHPDQLETQLEKATRSFLQTETEVDKARKEIHLSRLLLWYRADFGGGKGIKALLSNYLDLDPAGYRLVYQPYNWEENLDNFWEEH